MISRIHSTTIVVSNQDAALDFYVNVLGWEKRLDAQIGDAMRFLTVAPAGAATELVLADPVWAGGKDGPTKVGGETGIALLTPDLDATYQTLAARGVQFKQPPAVMPWGQPATWFVDPDGNEFFLAAE
ncbi:MAG TPA: VOC family protein [Thermomicrobiales bacterium]|jgi:catechol 2,3-dioxygenase-like lactoylglutathione lyase family enzyme|nr:VOC family protein [Thermomicrobiales bacterium]